MVTEDPVDLNLTMSPSSRKIPALHTKNSALPCQVESCGEIMWIRVRPIDDYDDDDDHGLPINCALNNYALIMHKSDQDFLLSIQNHIKNPQQGNCFCESVLSPYYILSISHTSFHENLEYHAKSAAGSVVLRNNVQLCMHQ